MKRSKSEFRLVFIIFLLNSFSMIYGQVEKIEQTLLFGSRIKDPIEMDVKVDGDKIIMNVNNKSYYPYDFVITFGDFVNLSPKVYEQRTILTPGLNRLFVFKIVNPEEEPKWSYKISYSMSKSGLKTDPWYPYLIPVGAGKTVNLESSKVNDLITYYLNCFSLEAGDTVFASRKGVITALPGDPSEVDRIKAGVSLEIRHSDATTAIYIGLDPEKLFVKSGQQVYPGQPLGIISAKNLLTFSVYELKGEGQLQSIDINYADTGSNLISAGKINAIKAEYQKEIIKKEMTKREISKFEKGNLY